jgi:hypothetical protein
MKNLKKFNSSNDNNICSEKMHTSIHPLPKTFRKLDYNPQKRKSILSGFREIFEILENLKRKK